MKELCRYHQHEAVLRVEVELLNQPLQQWRLPWPGVVAQPKLQQRQPLHAQRVRCQCLVKLLPLFSAPACFEWAMAHCCCCWEVSVTLVCNLATVARQGRRPRQPKKVYCLASWKWCQGMASVMLPLQPRLAARVPTLHCFDSSSTVNLRLAPQVEWATPGRPYECQMVRMLDCRPMVPPLVSCKAAVHLRGLHYPLACPLAAAPAVPGLRRRVAIRKVEVAWHWQQPRPPRHVRRKVPAMAASSVANRQVRPAWIMASLRCSGCPGCPASHGGALHRDRIPF